MCHAGYVPGRESCGFFQWAEFDEDGEPQWAEKVKMKEGSLNEGGRGMKAVIDSGVLAHAS